MIEDIKRVWRENSKWTMLWDAVGLACIFGALFGALFLGDVCYG